MSSGTRRNPTRKATSAAAAGSNIHPGAHHQTDVPQQQQQQHHSGTGSARRDLSVSPTTDPIPTGPVVSAAAAPLGGPHQLQPPSSSASTAMQTQIHPGYHAQPRMIKREQGEGGVGGLDEDDGPIFTNILLPEAPPGAPTASAPGIAGLRRSSSKNNTPVMMGMGIGIAIKPDQQGSPGYMMMKPPDGSGLYYHYENWDPRQSAHSPPSHYQSPIPNYAIAPPPVPTRGALWAVAEQYQGNEPAPSPNESAQVRSRYMPADYDHVLAPPARNTLKDLSSLAVQFDINDLPAERRHPNGVNWIVQSPEDGYALMRQLEKEQRLRDGRSGQANSSPNSSADGHTAGHMPSNRPGPGAVGISTPLRQSPHTPGYGSAPVPPPPQGGQSQSQTQAPGPNSNATPPLAPTMTTTAYAAGSGNNSGNMANNGTNASGGSNTGLRTSSPSAGVNTSAWPRTNDSGPPGWNAPPTGEEASSASGPQASPTRPYFAGSAGPPPPGWQHAHPSSAHPNSASPPVPAQYWHPSAGGPPPHGMSPTTRQTWSAHGRPPPSHPGMAGRPWPPPSQHQSWGPPPPGAPHPHAHPPHHNHPPGSEPSHSIANVPNTNWPSAPHGLANPPSGTIPLENIDGMRWVATPTTGQPPNHPWDPTGGPDANNAAANAAAANAAARRSRAGTATGGRTGAGSGNASPTTWSPGPAHAPWMNAEGMNPNLPLEGRIQTPGGTGAGPNPHPASQQAQQQAQQQQQQQQQQQSSSQPTNPANQAQFGGPPSGYGMYPTQGVPGTAGRELPYGSQPDSVVSYNGERGPPGGPPPSGAGGPTTYPAHAPPPPHQGGNTYPSIPMTPTTTGAAPYGIPRQAPGPGNPPQPGQQQQQQQSSGPPGQPQLHQQPPPNAQANVYPNVYAMQPQGPPPPSQQPGGGGMPLGEPFMYSGPGGPPPPITYPLNPGANPMGQRMSVNQGGPNPAQYAAWSYGRPFDGNGAA